MTFVRVRVRCFILVLLSALSAKGCDTPIYQYALENWEPAKYTLMILHRGAPLLETLRPLLDAAHGNLKVADIDLDAAPTPESQKFVEQSRQKDSSMLLFNPSGTGFERAVWSGAPTPENLKSLLSSPARRRLITALASGNAAVWVLLECGDKSRDDSAAAALQKSLSVVSADTAALSDDKAPQFRLSLLRVGANDPAESIFVRMLVQTSPEGDTPNQPRAFLVFGRGRALGPLSGDAIATEQIARATAFLSGPCLCEIKERNPGIDLLLDANWSELLRHSKHRLTKLTPMETETAAPPLEVKQLQTLASPGIPQNAPTNSPSSATDTVHEAPNRGLIAAGVMIALGILSLLFSFKSRRSAR